MKIKFKNKGMFVVSFEEYFKTNDDLIKFIREKNEFINPEGILDRVEHVYKSLSESSEEIKSSVLDLRIIKELDFKHKRPVKLEFWEERGYGIKEFNEYCKKTGIGNNQFSKVEQRGVLNSLDKENIFEYGSFEFKNIGVPKCNICHTNLNVNPSVGKYIINSCNNDKCESGKNLNVNTIRQLAFLPFEIFREKNERINLNSKLNKEYWLLNGYSYEDSIGEIEKIKKQVENIGQNSIEHYQIVYGMNFEDAKFKHRSGIVTNLEFWISRGFSEEESKERVRELQKNNSLKFSEKRIENPGAYSAMTHTQLAYWLNKGFSECEAREKLRDRQQTFSLEKCIEKYGEEEGEKRWRDRQEKWLKNYKRNNYSKISQELFWGIYEKTPLCYKIKNEIYFATLNQETKTKEEESRNNEYRLRLSKKVILPDFIVFNEKKIIEFDGVYYHRATPENKKRERERDEQIKKSGYEVLHVSEAEYKNNKQEVINKCLEFLEIKK